MLHTWAANGNHTVSEQFSGGEEFTDSNHVLRIQMPNVALHTHPFEEVNVRAYVTRRVNALKGFVGYGSATKVKVCVRRARNVQFAFGQAAYHFEAVDKRVAVFCNR